MPYTKELNNNREKICFVLSQYHYRHKQRKLSLVNFHKKDTQNMVCEVRKTEQQQKKDSRAHLIFWSSFLKITTKH